jgi:hypothetical protein
MHHEYSSLIDKGTAELVDLPPDRVVVNNMWIYKVKSDTVGDVSRFKAQFVAKGCSQRAGLDYTETCSPVIRMANMILFLAIARDLELCQFDIDTSFLYAPIKEDVYIRQPLGYSDGTFKVCHLKRCLYGLKQSPREFNMLLRAWLVDNGWQQCVSDPCMFYIFRTGHVFAMIAMYVDDIPAACNDTTWLASFKALLGARFKIKDPAGALSQLLGMHITRNRSARTISLDQSKYLRDILAKYGMTDAKPSSLPLDPGFLAGLAHMTSPPLTGVAKDVYPSLLGSL